MRSRRLLHLTIRSRYIQACKGRLQLERRWKQLIVDILSPLCMKLLQPEGRGTSGTRALHTLVTDSLTPRVVPPLVSVAGLASKAPCLVCGLAAEHVFLQAFVLCLFGIPSPRPLYSVLDIKETTLSTTLIISLPLYNRKHTRAQERGFLVGE